MPDFRSLVDVAVRKHRPALVAVVRDDGTESTIKPTGRKGRWERVVASVPPDASRVELRDDDGDVVFALQPDDDDDAPAKAASASGMSGEVERMLDLMLRAQQSALDRQRSQLDSLLHGYSQLAQVLASRLGSLERTYSDVMRAQYEAAASSGAETENSADALLSQFAPLAMAAMSANGAKPI